MSATVQRHGAGITWYEGDAMARASHALLTEDGVWLVDPFDDQAALDAAADLGPPAGVVQLLSRHNRDCAAIATRLGVALHRLPARLPGTPLEVVSVVDRPWWRELALWWPGRQTLVVSEAIGTIPLFALGRPAGVHPMLRLLPPRAALGGYHPERLLVGHGPALAEGADAALHEALAAARSDLPRLALKLPGTLRGGPRRPASG
ncbi:MAG TPA: hypothetical protein VF781_03155 [Solirubrobacteraceae bacterium]